MASAVTLVQTVIPVLIPVTVAWMGVKPCKDLQVKMVTLA